jgi:CheY-like chemotaxis protein
VFSHEWNKVRRSAAVILLVEDNEADAILTQMTLENAGIRAPVQVVKTVEAAMAYLGGEGDYADTERFPLPQVVFVDLNLPGRSGHDVLGWMQGNEDLRNVVRVVLTGSDDPADLKLAYELGANCYLRKPLTIEQLTQPGRNIRMLFAEPRLAGIG